MRRPIAVPAFASILLLSLLVSAPGAAAPAGIADALTSLLASRRHPWVEGGRFPDVGAAVDSLVARGGGPRWLVDGRPSAAAWAVLGRLERAPELGLPPASYADRRLVAEASALAAAPAGSLERDPARLARFDAALSVDALRFVTALARGRVQPDRVHETLRIARPPFDAVSVVDSLARGLDADGVISRVQPPWRHYRALLDALARYRTIARDTTLVPLPGLPKVLKPGDPYAGGARLRRLLLALGDLPAAQARTDIVDTLYDETLVAAVKNFQSRQGLKADGVLGPGTAQRLQRPIDDRVVEIELALERWRWLPHAFDEPPIFVNVPAFRLYAFTGADDAEAGMTAMDVVVGKAFDTATPLFTETMKYVIFRPYWEVPPSIANRDIREKALRDPGYLVRGDYELVQGSTVLPPTTAAISAIGRGVRVRQKPGPDNALGLVKFMLPNPYSIYLHDTNSKGRFAAERRDFSHGCIRVSDPVALAQHVLRQQPAWTKAKIETAMNAERPLQVNLERPIPVLIVYATAVAEENGRLHLYPDVYGLDQELTKLLAEGYPYDVR